MIEKIVREIKGLILFRQKNLTKFWQKKIIFLTVLN